MKKCREDQILNPLTNRCVKKTGKIGQQLQANINPSMKKIKTKDAKDPKCKDDEVLNPFTNRCVKKSKDIGRQLVENANLTHEIEFVKNDKTVTIKVNIGLLTAKTITVNNKIHKYVTIQQVYEHLSDFADDYLKSGYTVKTVQLQQATKYIQSMIDNFFKCKTVEPVVKPLECINDSTMIMMEPIKKLPRDRVITLKDGYCFDIEELYDSIIATNSLKNPLTNNILNNDDVNQLIRMLKNKKMDTKQLEQLIKKAASLPQMLVAEQGFASMLNELLILGLVCICDYTNDFGPSQRALAGFYEKHKARTAIIQSLTNKSGTYNLDHVLKSTSNTCIHGIGFSLLNIAFNNYVECKKYDKHLRIPPYIKPINDNMFMFLNHSIYYIYELYVYDHTLSNGNMMRLCKYNIQTRNISADSSAYNQVPGFNDNKASTYMFEHPEIEVELSIIGIEAGIDEGKIKALSRKI